MSLEQKRDTETPFEREGKELFKNVIAEMAANIRAANTSISEQDSIRRGSQILTDRWTLAAQQYERIVGGVVMPRPDEYYRKGEFTEHLKSAQTGYASRLGILWIELERMFMTGGIYNRPPEEGAGISSESAKKLVILLSKVLERHSEQERTRNS